MMRWMMGIRRVSVVYWLLITPRIICRSELASGLSLDVDSLAQPILCVVEGRFTFLGLQVLPNYCIEVLEIEKVAHIMRDVV